MDGKLGLKKKGAGESMSKWTLPQPSIYKPETQPAKPQSGAQGKRYASKTANTSSGTGGGVNSIKSRW